MSRPKSEAWREAARQRINSPETRAKISAARQESKREGVLFDHATADVETPHTPYAPLTLAERRIAWDALRRMEDALPDNLSAEERRETLETLRQLLIE